MGLPPPTEKQARILWVSVTALAIGVLVALIGLFLWGLAWLVQRLSSVLLPLAIAGILAYLLDPVVDFLERRRISRLGSIFSVFFLAVLAIAIVLATLVPRLISETEGLIKQLPQYSQVMQSKINEFLTERRLKFRLPALWPYSRQKPPEMVTTDSNVPPIIVAGQTNQTDRIGSEPMRGAPGTMLTPKLGAQLLTWLTAALPKIGSWMLDQLSKVASWLGLLIGLALVPVYTFYFLLEKSGISENWSDYLPIHESRAKEELVFALQSINDYLILFFRGQVLVAMCDGALLTIGFLAIGLNYAFLLGLAAGALSIVPFLGVVISLIPALVLAAVQFGDWLHPALVLAIFGLVQMAEGLFISPRIMGDRVGLHPLTIIIAVMIGTTLLGGILGGILAIPLTAALRVLMFRYVWKKRSAPAADPLM